MKIILSLVFLGLSLFVNAQMPSPVHWNVDIHTEGSEQFISLDAHMDGEWVLYSQHTNDDGPIPTMIEYSIKGDAKLDGETEELSNLIVKYSKLFEVDVKKFKHEAKFRQNIKVSGHGSINVDVTYMTCSGNKCLPPHTETFELIY